VDGRANERDDGVRGLGRVMAVMQHVRGSCYPGIGVITPTG
jgi:hypothetical protein